MSRKSLSEFHDMIPYLILKAPDNFPSSYSMDLKRAFSIFSNLMIESKKEFGSAFGIVETLVQDALDAYERGDQREGIRLLQELYEMFKQPSL